MYLVDANVLLYAVDASSFAHHTSRRWLEEVLNGHARVGLPSHSIAAFLRISTHPRVMRQPLAPTQAWGVAETWLSAPAAWVPEVTDHTVSVLGRLIVDHHITGDLVSDAQLAAQAMEHGLTIATMDSDFARFPVRTLDPREAMQGSN